MDNNNNKISPYESVGLDAYMRPINSPASNQGSFVGGMEFNTRFDRNSVTAINLRNFSFNAGTGGTIVLGGASNGNGVMRVKDAGGTTRVLADNTGITITDGKLTFINSVGGTVLDGSGVVSTTSFPTNSITDATGYTTTSTTATDVPGATLSPFVVGRTTRALILVSAQGRNNNYIQDGSSMQVIFNDSLQGDILDYPEIGHHYLTGISQNGTGLITGWSYNLTSNFFTVGVITDFSAGTHTVKLRYKVNGTGTANLGLYQFGYILLGA